jgi:hypothetical protein
MRIRRLLVLGAGLVIAGVLIAPVVLSSSPTASSSRCHPHLRYMTLLYERRSAAGVATQSKATGVGVLGGCGQAPTNVNVRSLIGIDPVRAVAIDSDSDIYVRRGLCSRSEGAQLHACLTR